MSDTICPWEFKLYWRRSLFGLFSTEWLPYHHEKRWFDLERVREEREKILASEKDIEIKVEVVFHEKKEPKTPWEKLQELGKTMENNGLAIAALADDAKQGGAFAAREQMLAHIHLGEEAIIELKRILERRLSELR